MTDTHRMLAQSRAAQAVEERLDVLAVLPKFADADFRRQQAESITKACLAVYFGALEERPVVVTGLHGKVIGGINAPETCIYCNDEPQTDAHAPYGSAICAIDAQRS